MDFERTHHEIIDIVLWSVFQDVNRRKPLNQTVNLSGVQHQRFNLFLEVAAPFLAGRTLSLPGQKCGNIAGLALIDLGTGMIGIAAVRFVRTAKNSGIVRRSRSASSNASNSFPSW
jgi:hypothetical protein